MYQESVLCLPLQTVQEILVEQTEVSLPSLLLWKVPESLVEQKEEFLLELLLSKAQVSLEEHHTVFQVWLLQQMVAVLVVGYLEVIRNQVCLLMVQGWVRECSREFRRLLDLVLKGPELEDGCNLDSQGTKTQLRLLKTKFGIR